MVGFLLVVYQFPTLLFERSFSFPCLSVSGERFGASKNAAYLLWYRKEP